MPNSQRQGTAEAGALGIPYTRLLRGCRGVESLPREQGLRTRPGGRITPQGQMWLGVDTGAQEPATRQHLEPDHLGSNPGSYTSPPVRS